MINSDPQPTNGTLDPTFFSTGSVVTSDIDALPHGQEDRPSSDAIAPETTGEDQSQNVIRPQLPPKPTTARYNTLDVVRGMACLMLMFYHATFYAERSWISSDPSTWTLGGLGINLVGRLWMGVPMFFRRQWLLHCGQHRFAETKTAFAHELLLPKDSQNLSAPVGRIRVRDSVHAGRWIQQHPI